MMKKLGILLAAFVCVSILLTGCDSSKSDETPTKDVREVTWHFLDKHEKEEVVGTWKDATVSKVKAEKDRFFLLDDSFEGKEVTLVIFRSRNNALLGNIEKLIDEKSGKVIGGGIRE